MTEEVRISVEALQTRLEEIVLRAYRGESFVILVEDEPVAILCRHPEATPSVFGLGVQ